MSAVDEHQAREILGAINKQKKTVVLAMHDRTLALEYTDRVVGIRDGQIVLDEPTAGMTPGDLGSSLSALILFQGYINGFRACTPSRLY